MKYIYPSISDSCQLPVAPLSHVPLPEIFNLCKTNLTAFDDLAETLDLCRM